MEERVGYRERGGKYSALIGQYSKYSPLIGQVIDISLYPFPENWESYNHWMEGDLHLDWDWPEEGQGEFAPDENDPTEYPVSL